MNELKHILPGEPIPVGSSFHARRHRVAQNLIGNFQADSLLLDIGSGNAGQTEFFARHTRLSLGLDLQISRLNGFQRDLQKRGISNITLLGGNAQQLPFHDGSFDYLTCFEMLEHVQSEQQTLSEIKRVLKPGGTLIMSVPHRWWVFETHGANLPLLPWNRVPFFSWLPTKIHDRWARARIYTQREIQDQLMRTGFGDIETRLLTAPMDVVKNPTIQKLLRSTIFTGDTTRIPLLASTIFVYAKNCT
jgi:ubiquinone/menaquinone biosynthesis C-methylase UbiE